MRSRKRRWATVIRAETGLDVRHAQGAGASGGLGAVLIAFAGATLHPRFDIVMNYLDFDRPLTEADLVVTAKGSLDGQSAYDKASREVAAFASLLKRPCTPEEAMKDGERLLRRAAQDAMRMMCVGLRMSQRHRAA